MRPKSLRHIRTAATDLDDGPQYVAGLAAGTAEFRGHPEVEYACPPDRLDGLVLQNPIALGRRVVATERGDDLGQPGEPLFDRSAEWLIGERPSRLRRLRV